LILPPDPWITVKGPIVLTGYGHGKTVTAPLCGLAGGLSVLAVAKAVGRMAERLKADTDVRRSSAQVLEAAGNGKCLISKYDPYSLFARQQTDLQVEHVKELQALRRMADLAVEHHLMTGSSAQPEETGRCVHLRAEAVAFSDITLRDHG
jgi:hypothetical protein